MKVMPIDSNWQGRLKMLCDRYGLKNTKPQGTTANLIRKLPDMQPEAREYMIRLIRENRV